MNETYQQMQQQFQTGQITEQQWKDFCMTVLEKLMQQNKDVFERLKVR